MMRRVIATTTLLLLSLGCQQQKIYDPVGAQGACEQFMRHAFAGSFPADAHLDIDPSNVLAEPGSPVHRVLMRATMRTSAGITPITATCTVRKDADNGDDRDWTLVGYDQRP